MAKIEGPYETFRTTKRLSERLLLKNRREGDTVTFKALTKKMVFFKETHDDLIRKILQERWDALTTEQKNEWQQLGITVFMDGKTLFKQQEKKSMTQGFYGIAAYGATRNKGIIKTKYSTLYGETIYGVGKYRSK